MAQQCRDLTRVLSPLDTTTVMEILVKLRDATYQNVYRVMQNNDLALDNSFMTPAQKAAIQKVSTKRSERETETRETKAA